MQDTAASSDLAISAPAVLKLPAWLQRERAKKLAVPLTILVPTDSSGRALPIYISQADPGSEAKIQELIERFDRRESLWHPNDAAGVQDRKSARTIHTGPNGAAYFGEYIPLCGDYGVLTREYGNGEDFWGK